MPSLAERVSQSVDRRQYLNQSLDQDEGEEGSQEDVFDEGEDVLNRRLPIVVNINGSIPNQGPVRVIGFQGEERMPMRRDMTAVNPNMIRS